MAMLLGMDAPTLEPPPARTRRWGTVFGVSAFLATALLWVYGFSGLPDSTPPDRLDDREWAAAAEERCAVAKEAIDALRPAQLAPSPESRADDVDAGTAIVDGLLDDLDSTAPGGRDGELVALWLADYRTYLGDRIAYTAALRSGEDPRFGISTSANGDPIDRRLDGFARANTMPSCSVPRDV